MVLASRRAKIRNIEPVKTEIAFCRDDPHDDCTHWIGVI